MISQATKKVSRLQLQVDERKILPSQKVQSHAVLDTEKIFEGTDHSIEVNGSWKVKMFSCQAEKNCTLLVDTSVPRRVYTIKNNNKKLKLTQQIYAIGRKKE